MKPKIDYSRIDRYLQEHLGESIAELSRLFTLAPGDVIFTGTPAGVGAVARGDVMHGHVDGIGDLTVRVA